MHKLDLMVRKLTGRRTGSSAAREAFGTGLVRHARSRKGRLACGQLSIDVPLE
jgi:hypothetical protein